MEGDGPVDDADICCKLQGQPVLGPDHHIALQHKAGQEGLKAQATQPGVPSTLSVIALGVGYALSTFCMQ